MQFPASNKRLRGVLYWLVAAGLLIAAAIALVSADWYLAEPPMAVVDASYVGRSACIDCHEAEHDEFVGSHHDRAMELATDEAVIGDFDNAEFERLGVRTRFFRRGDEFWVNTEGPDGEYHDYQIKYTFGIDPLQQYMVEFPDGRVQVLRVSWDTHKKEWFYVPPPDAVDERLAPDDPTHWTGIAQNWNTTCAECHSTNLQKNYDLATDSYHTTFSEIDVSCEACHGPGSLHVKLANSRSLFWDRRHGYGLAKLKSLDSTPQLETCAKCHSRRTEVHPDFRPGKPFADYYDPSLLEGGLYHADGQILDEVYVYGSFLQSRMHREGVRCTDCHNPHSLKLKFDGNALCAMPRAGKVRYAGASSPRNGYRWRIVCGVPHAGDHLHGGRPAARSQHSRTSPRPDGIDRHAQRLQHLPHQAGGITRMGGREDRGVVWRKAPDDPHWAPAIAAGREADPAAEADIIKAINRPTTPAIVQATLCQLLSQYRSSAARSTVESALSSPHAIVRRAAVANLPADTPQQLAAAAVPLLSDPVRKVRIAAAVRLLALPSQALDPAAREQLDAAVAEFEQQLHMADERAAGAHSACTTRASCRQCR